jgi:hypothetical protein
MRNAAIILLLGIFVLNAQEAETSLIEVQSVVDTSVITIGDRITYSIIIDRAKKLRIEKPGEGLNLGMFEIKDYKFHDPERRGDRLIERFDFNISVYDTGKFVIPPFPVAYFLTDTSRVFRIIEAPAIDIFVKSVLQGDAKRELKDIKPPLSIPFDYKFWIWMGVIAALVAVIIFLAYRLYKKRQERGYLFTPPPPLRPAHEIALEALGNLFRSDLLAKGQIKAFFSELSQIMRVYLEGRYFISALEETTYEIMRDLKKAVDEEELREQLHRILTLSDLAKFAKHIPEDVEIEQVKTGAVHFVEATRLLFEAPAAEVPATSVVAEKE